MTRLTRLLLLILVMLMLLPGLGRNFDNMKTSPKNVEVKSLEAYWAETDLNEMDLLRRLEDVECRSNQRQFLACVNAVTAMAEKSRLKVTTTGQIQAMTAADFDRHLSEKVDLAEWQTAFPGPEFQPAFSFIEVYLDIKSRLNDPAKFNALLATGINAYFSIAVDPHTYIVPLAYYEEVLSQGESKQPHLGFITRRIKGGVLIRKVATGSPAMKAGLKKGDRIIALNGQPVTQLPPTEWNDLTRGPVGSRLRVLLEREVAGQVQRREVELFQEETRFVSVEHRVLEGPRRIGVLTINKFAKDTCQLARRQVISMMEESIQGMILDLRDNPGGQVEEAACVSGLFVPAGSALFHTQYLDPLKRGEMYWAEGPQIYDGPMAVLMNSGSASAAEIVAGVMKDLGRAVLVGERSFGKGSFQDGMMWKGHQKIALFQTQGFYYFASGWTPQIVGLQPDLPVRLQSPGFASALREEDLYLTPLRPLDLWTGPQALPWLAARGCNESLTAAEFDEDSQVQQAITWMGCRSDERTAERRERGAGL